MQKHITGGSLFIVQFKIRFISVLIINVNIDPNISH
jgi:hypothetical protein